MPKSIHCIGLCLALAVSAASSFAQALKVQVKAAASSVREAPVTLTVPASWLPQVRPLEPGETPCQVETVGGGRVQVTWIVRDLKRGKSRTYLLVPAKRDVGTGVRLWRVGNDVEFGVNGKLLTKYDVTTGPNKPYFYPLIVPGGRQVVRHWPVEKREGESTDHPHHRGLWFTHGDLNGVDFWTEGEGTGKTVHTGYDALESGPIYGFIRAKTDWITPQGKKIAEDTRYVRVYNVEEGALMDVTLSITAVGGPLVWGDTKEGTFGLRLADSMRLTLEDGKAGKGQILNSEGVKGADTWGKPAAWCDFSGPVAGKVVGVTIMDSPFNPRHPTYWHVRDYGLFAANPFGLHDFNPKADRNAGRFIQQKGQSFTLRYRIYLHDGSADQAHVVDVWNAFATPPALDVETVRITH